MNRSTSFFLGVAATVGAAAAWHGPGGGGERLVGAAEQVARRTLDHYELPAVSARMERGPIERTLVLSGPADDFQRGELVRIMNDVPGVAAVRWESPRGSVRPRASLPLIAEAGLLALVGFAAGLLLTYLLELRRRARRYDRF